MFRLPEGDASTTTTGMHAKGPLRQNQRAHNNNHHNDNLPRQSVPQHYNKRSKTTHTNNNNASWNQTTRSTPQEAHHDDNPSQINHHINSTAQIWEPRFKRQRTSTNHEDSNAPRPTNPYRHDNNHPTQQGAQLTDILWTHQPEQFTDILRTQQQLAHGIYPTQQLEQFTDILQTQHTNHYNYPQQRTTATTSMSAVDILYSSQDFCPSPIHHNSQQSPRHNGLNHTQQHNTDHPSRSNQPSTQHSSEPTLQVSPNGASSSSNPHGSNHSPQLLFPQQEDHFLYNNKVQGNSCPPVMEQKAYAGNYEGLVSNTQGLFAADAGKQDRKWAQLWKRGKGKDIIIVNETHSSRAKCTAKEQHISNQGYRAF